MFKLDKMTRSAPAHQHHSGNLVRQQVAYAGSALALTTAREIIAAKISHSRRLLIPYRQSRQRAGDDTEKLTETVNKLSHLASQAKNAGGKMRLMQIEAQAAKLYWQAFGQIAHQKRGWKRVHPHASDPLNILLNTGYTLLARRCLQAITDTGLLPEIGLLHGENSCDPLVYDLMEIFRQVAVDSIILPTFSRRPRPGVGKDSRAFIKTIALLNLHYQRHFWYKKRCEKLENIIKLDATNLKQSILANQTWQPYRHQWSRHRVCKQ